MIRGEFIEVHDVWKDEEIIELCGDAGAIDAPLTRASGFRKVDRMAMRVGARLLPPSWMPKLVERAMKLSSKLSLIETHPTTSEKNLVLKVEGYKDHFDAAICALTYVLYLNKMTLRITAEDGEIHLIPKGIKIELKEIENGMYTFRV